MNYQLQIKDKKFQFRIADLFPDEEIPMNYQGNNLAELKDVQANYSQKISLPMTVNNIQIFDYTNERSVFSHFPYKKHPCWLLVDGINIVGSNAFLIIDKITDCFECQILSGNSDIFEYLKTVKLSDINYPTHYLDLHKKEQPLSDDFYKYSIAHFAKNWRGVDILYPFIKLENLLYRLIGNRIVSNVDFSQYGLSLTSLKPVDLTVFNAHAEGINNSSSSDSQYISVGVTSNGKGLLKHTSNDGVTQDGVVGVTYRMPEKGSIDFQYNLSGTINNAQLILVIDKIGADVSEFRREYVNVTSTKTTSISAEKEERVRVSLYWEINQGATSAINVSVDFYFKNMTTDVAPDFSGIRLQDNLGLETAFDLVKSIVQYFGFMTNVNASDNLVLNTFDSFYQKIQTGEYVDWSKKVHDAPNSISFHRNEYAQHSKIKLQKNENQDSEDTAEIVINDETLPFEKDILTINFEGADSGTFVYGNNIVRHPAYIVMCEFHSIVKPSAAQDYLMSFTFLPKKKPTLVKFEEAPGEIWEHDSQDGPYGYLIGGQSGYDFAVYEKLSDSVNVHYSGLKKILNQSKIFEDDFFLTPLDIQNFDSLKPVYIAKYGAFFYVNKIKNFVAGKLTKCELIKL